MQKKHFGEKLGIVAPVEEDLPVFSQIKDILAFNGEYFLQTADLKTLSFAEHFHSFHVIQVNHENVSMPNSFHSKLCFFKSFDLQTTYGFDRNYLYLVPVHAFVRETCNLTT